ncbi:hypothetical protein EB151_10385, partial [archaeon]|nr:hypothetical protein [archaeon]
NSQNLNDNNKLFADGNALDNFKNYYNQAKGRLAYISDDASSGYVDTEEKRNTVRDSLKIYSLTPNKVISMLTPTQDDVNNFKAMLDAKKAELMVKRVIQMVDGRFEEPQESGGLTNLFSNEIDSVNRDISLTGDIDNQLSALITYNNSLIAFDNAILGYQKTIYDNMKDAINSLTESDEMLNFNSVFNADGTTINNDSLSTEIRRYLNRVIDRIQPETMDVDMYAIREDMRFYGVGQISSTGLSNASVTLTKLMATSPHVAQYLETNTIDADEFRLIVAVLQRMGVVDDARFVFDDFEYASSSPSNLEPGGIDNNLLDSHDIVYTDSDSNVSYIVQEIINHEQGGHQIFLDNYNGYIWANNNGYTLWDSNNQQITRSNIELSQYEKSITARGSSWSIYTIERSLQVSDSTIQRSTIEKVLELMQESKPISSGEFDSIKTAISNNNPYFQVSGDVIWAKRGNSYDKGAVRLLFQNNGFDENRAAFIAELLKAPWQSFNNISSDTIGQKILDVNSEKTDFSTASDYTQQLEVYSNFQQFMSKYIELYYLGV